MKKLLAIFVFVLMLCAMLPFATVAAAEDTTIELIASEVEVNAGDEFEVEVNLKNIPEPGLIAALVEVMFDNDVFELVTYFDEDEEMWFPPIEVGSKYNASSNKYITFSPIDEETGAMNRCLVKYVRALASATQTRTEELFFTVTFKVKDDAVSGTYDLYVNDSTQNFLLLGNVEIPVKGGSVSIKVNGTEPACEHEYNYDCDKVCALCGEETNPEAEHEYYYACDAHCMHCGELTNEEAAHSIIAVDAVAPTCTEIGNLAYWYCEHCGAAWLNAECTQKTNLKAVKLPMADHEYYYACDAHCMNCGELTNEEAAHNIIAVEAVAPTCTEIGNLAYWYCEYCGAAWLNAECTQKTNLKAVKLPMAEHTYANAHDADCNVCGTEREIVLAAEDIILFGGNSVTEIKGGLAFKFNAAVDGITFDKEYVADYSNATVTIENVEYKLVKMGAIVNNQQLANQTLDDITTGMYVVDVPAKKVFEDAAGMTCYAVRVINIPQAHLDSEIIARPYYVYENANGEQITVYGEDCSATYNSVLNK